MKIAVTMIGTVVFAVLSLTEAATTLVEATVAKDESRYPRYTLRRRGRVTRGGGGKNAPLNEPVVSSAVVAASTNTDNHHHNKRILRRLGIDETVYEECTYYEGGNVGKGPSKGTGETDDTHSNDPRKLGVGYDDECDEEYGKAGGKGKPPQVESVL